MAGPIRFRYSTESWTLQRVTQTLFEPLDIKFGATLSQPAIAPPPEYDARRFTMENGDLAMFAWKSDGRDGYWLGNTETPQILWRTEKITFDDAPFQIARWAQRLLLEELAKTDPWLASYRYLSWFFLPVLFSKDGRQTTRTFFREHAAGFPDTTREAALEFYDTFLSTGVLEDHRYTMATKLGTSEQLDIVRMRASMAEINTAKILHDAGYEFTPEIELESGYTLDYRVTDPNRLIEVTRPNPPSRRRAGTPSEALRETVDGKTTTQLAAHDTAVLFVDCSSFFDDAWQSLLAEQPSVGYQPAVIYRIRPSGKVQGYECGQSGLELSQQLQ